MPRTQAGTLSTHSKALDAIICGRLFRCHQCTRQHRVNSGPMKRCAEEFAKKHTSDPWEQEYKDLCQSLSNRCRDFYLEYTKVHFGPALLPELIDNNGSTLLKARHSEWLERHHHKNVNIRTELERIRAQLDALYKLTQPTA